MLLVAYEGSNANIKLPLQPAGNDENFLSLKWSKLPRKQPFVCAAVCVLDLLVDGGFLGTLDHVYVCATYEGLMATYVQQLGCFTSLLGCLATLLVYPRDNVLGTFCSWT